MRHTITQLTVLFSSSLLIACNSTPTKPDTPNNIPCAILKTHDTLRIQTTALNYAIRSGNFDDVECLLAHGADASFPDSAGITPLIAATQQNKEKAVSLLLAYDANPNHPFNKTGDEAVCNAVIEQSFDEFPLSYAEKNHYTGIALMLKHIGHAVSLRNCTDYRSVRDTNEMQELEWRLREAGLL